MSSDIFAVNPDGKLLRLGSKGFESEDMLQSLLEEYPEILSGKLIDPRSPRKWILVLREAGVPDSSDSGSRWSIDHLLLDQDGIPTLVEVKRSTDTRIRREVVGQLLDYAANAVAYWPVNRLRDWFEERCDSLDLDSERLISDLTDGGDADQFWSRVKTNLQAKKLRLVFAADQIPKELRRIIEFLNEQMDPTEVLGIELSRYSSQEGIDAIVPRVFGLTADAESRKDTVAVQGERWTPERFFESLNESSGEASVELAKSILEWAEVSSSRVRWGIGRSDGSFKPVFVGRKGKVTPFSVWSTGSIELNFQYIRQKAPYVELKAREQLAKQIASITGQRIEPGKLDRRPSFPIDSLDSTAKFKRFLDLMEEVATSIKG